MRNKKAIRFFALSAAFLSFGLASCGAAPKFVEPINDGWEGDNAYYAKNITKKLANPDAHNDGEEEEETIPEVKTLILHYHNDDGRCGEREFYLWSDEVDGMYLAKKTVHQSGEDMMITLDFTGEFDMFAGAPRVGLIIKFTSGWTGQSEDTYLNFDKYRADANGKVELWILPGEGISLDVFLTEAETKFDKVKTAKFTTWKNIKCEATITPTVYRLYAFDETYYRLDNTLQEQNKEFYLLKSGKPDKATFNITLNYQAHINVSYMLETQYSTAPTRVQMINVGFENLYKNTRFTTYYNYDGDDLGVTYTKRKTTFKVWAPTSTYVKLNIYNSGSSKKYAAPGVYTSDSVDIYDMFYQPGGVWAIELEGDLNGKYYTFTFKNQGGVNETVDPYVKACGINGERGMVLDFESTNPEGWDDVVYDDIQTKQELIIYETHVRDVTMHSTWGGTQEPGTFNAMAEQGTRYKGTVKTGFDHIKDLGVNAVQLLPVFDHNDNEVPEKRGFNWGYDPTNYNCVEGTYATDPYKGDVRVREFKSLIRDLASKKDKNGNDTNQIRTIMDVVYNHQASAANSTFTKIVPKYYYRYNSDWAYYNGSECGNEIKTEAPMMRKFIVDSLKWWATEYKIKGFRFDLMGLIDTQTMRAAADALYDIDPDIAIYGEGWMGSWDNNFEDGWHGDRSGGTYSANTSNVYNKLGRNNKGSFVGGFNDCGRNALKGKNGTNELYGFISQSPQYGSDKIQSVKAMLCGINQDVDSTWKGDPEQTINYASCHDNFTLFDQFTYTSARNGDGDYPGMALAATVVAESAILVSNGVAFIQGGEELFRSKEVKSDADKKKITAYDEKGNAYLKDVMTINDKIISHNSYNLSDEVNAFDYSRKLTVDGVDTTKYFDSIKEAISARKQMKQFTRAEMNRMSDGFTVNTWDNTVNLVEYDNNGQKDWKKASGMVIGMANESAKGKYYFFISGEVEEEIGFGNITNATCIAASNKAYNNIGYRTVNVKYADENQTTGKGIKMGWSSSCLFKLNS